MAVEITIAEGREKSIEWGVAGRPMTGQTNSGDIEVVKFFEQGVLLAVIDGVGHGDEARLASGIAASTLKESAGESVIALVKQCHSALAGTRGAVMTLAILDIPGGTITWMGIGNVEGRLFRVDTDTNTNHACEHIMLRAGLVGLQLPPLQAALVPLTPGDLLVFATDGIRPDFEDGVNLTRTTAQIANGILNRHLKGNDDALVLVVRYLGLSS